MRNKNKFALLLLALMACSNSEINGPAAGDATKNDQWRETGAPALFSNEDPFGFQSVYVEGSSDSHFDGDVLVDVFPADIYGPGHSGYNFKSILPSGDTKTLTYEVMFASDFDFVEGGKLPGLCGGDAASGGTRADGRNGFSSRMMWRTDGRIVSYVYHVNQADDYGDDFPWKDSTGASLYFKKGVWEKIQLTVKINDVGQSNGSITGYFNGNLAFQKQNFVFRTKNTFDVDLLCFSTFFGGDSSDWAPPKNEKLYIRNVTIE